MLTFFIGLIPNLFYLLFFFVPLILWPYTSELFEFNKMILVYILTLLIAASWTAKMIQEKKIIFRRTILDIPLLIFLTSQILSTLTSIDPRTSFLGYYSRFHGGLLSTISYTLLYWAYVANMDIRYTLYSIRYTLYSAILVSIYGILQRFGIDKDIWVQDVQNRVFSTLGQPNWLAAYLVALMPLAWSASIYKQTQNHKFQILNTIPYFLSVLLFITLLFTKSRSGILGFTVADFIFWGFILIKYKKEFLKQFIIFNLSFVILFLVIGGPFRISGIQSQVSPSGPALETGGTESGEIRKIVWRGAIDIWKHNPILGTGPETFAYSYYRFRPTAHNLVSEWNFIYNKAHNEYLNFMANTGTLGILAYLILIGFSIYQILSTNKYQVQINTNSQSKLEIWNSKFVFIGIISGYSSLLVTNFFGFSVVPIALGFFLFPAMAAALANNQHTTNNLQLKKLDVGQKAAIIVLLLVVCWLLIVIARYWYSDIFYNKGKQFNSISKYPEALVYLQKAVKLSPKEALYRNELSQISAGLAEKAQGFTDFAVAQSNEAVLLSPANVNILRDRANLFYKLSKINPEYLTGAIEALLLASAKAPTDAKIFYNLGIMYLRTGRVNDALDVFQKTISLKPNYKEARLAYALTLIDSDKTPEAKEQLLYILEKIDPNDKTAKEELKKIE